MTFQKHAIEPEHAHIQNTEAMFEANEILLAAVNKTKLCVHRNYIIYSCACESIQHGERILQKNSAQTQARNSFGKSKTYMNRS